MAWLLYIVFDKKIGTRISRWAHAAAGKCSYVKIAIKKPIWEGFTKESKVQYPRTLLHWINYISTVLLQWWCKKLSIGLICNQTIYHRSFKVHERVQPTTAPLQNSNNDQAKDLHARIWETHARCVGYPWENAFKNLNTIQNQSIVPTPVWARRKLFYSRKEQSE